jgi:hypothetical protein
MADDKIPQAQAPVLDEGGKFTLPWFRFFAALNNVLATIANNASLVLLKAQNLADVASAPTAFANIKQAASGSTTGVVQQTQTFDINFQVARVKAEPITVILKSKRARVITEIVTQSISGTCTLTGDIDGTPLGGTANSVSTTEQERTHSSANSLAVGQNLVLTPSSVSSCRNMKVSVRGTYTLDA